MTTLCYSLPLSSFHDFCAWLSFISLLSSPHFFWCAEEKNGKREGTERERNQWWMAREMRKKERIGGVFRMYKYLNFKGASADVSMLKCYTTPPAPLLWLLLANHHTTLLYLGHSNVLLLPPLADALCCNLQKIGRKEEKSEEGVVKRTFSWTKNEALLLWFSSIWMFLLPLCLLVTFVTYADESKHHKTDQRWHSVVSLALWLLLFWHCSLALQ